VANEVSRRVSRPQPADGNCYDAAAQEVGTGLGLPKPPIQID